MRDPHADGGLGCVGVYVILGEERWRRGRSQRGEEGEGVEVEMGQGIGERVEMGEREGEGKRGEGGGKS